MDAGPEETEEAVTSSVGCGGRAETAEAFTPSLRSGGRAETGGVRRGTVGGPSGREREGCVSEKVITCKRVLSIFFMQFTPIFISVQR